MNCGSVSRICCSSWDFIVNMKRIGAEAAIVSALVFTAVGMGTGVASADQPLPSTPAITWKLDHGHGHGADWDWGDDCNGDWNGGWRVQDVLARFPVLFHHGQDRVLPDRPHDR